MSEQEENLIVNADRRKFTKSVGAMAGFAVLDVGALGANTLAFGADAVMSPNEDLMQEHALLNRVQLIYDEAIRRLQGGIDLEPVILKGAAQIIRRFVEEYHEKLEEDYVFPRFEKAGKLVDLVGVLRVQHKAGRTLTDTILSLTTLDDFKDPARRKKLVQALAAFVRMYRPHETREGSVLFPAFRELIPSQEFNRLGESFEKMEHEKLGAEGFEGQVQVVAELEKKLGLYDLAQYTPK